MKPRPKGAAPPPVPAPFSLGAADWVRRVLGFPADALQASVLEAQGKRGVINCSRQWGKSTTTAAKAVYHAFHHNASLILVVSPSARQSAEFLRKAAAFARKLGIAPKGDGDNQISLAFPNQSRIVGLPATEATNRGFSAVSLLLVDEAARVSDHLYRSLRPTLAVSAGALWLMSTPFGKRGFFYEAWAHGGPQWQRIRAPATDCPRIPSAFLEEERATMGERCFRQEYLCEFEDSVSGVFRRDLFDAAITPEILPLSL
jgi:hypothetical protein